MAPVVYLISGSGRGLGLALVQTLANRDNVLVFAGVRKPSSDLESVAAQYPENVKIITLLSGDIANNEAAVAQIKRIAGRLDVVIANAALGAVTGSAFATSPQSMVDHYSVNVVGPLVLFQTTYPLLEASTPTPKFIPISSSLGSIEVGATSGTDWFAYGVSKSALNYLAKKLRHDHDGLVCFPICPGLINTEMMNRGLAAMEHGLPPGSILKPASETARHVLARIDEGTRETDVFLQWDKQVLPY